METDVALNAHGKSEYQPAHTAEHLLNQTMVRMFGCERSRNAHVERKKSKLNYSLATCPTPEQVAEIERRVQEQIDRRLDVVMEYVTRDNVPPEVSLDKLPADASETLRLVRIGDYVHRSPCRQYVGSRSFPHFVDIVDSERRQRRRHVPRRLPSGRGERQVLKAESRMLKSSHKIAMPTAQNRENQKITLTKDKFSIFNFQFSIQKIVSLHAFDSARRLYK